MPLKSSQKTKLARVAARQLGLITLEQAVNAGLTNSNCHTLVVSGQWAQVERGLYRLAGSAETWEHRLWAACLATKGWASHVTAGWLYGLDGLGRHRPRELDVVVAYGNNRKSSYAKVRRSRTLLPTHISKAKGIPKTNLPRTLIDLSEVLGEDALEDAFDSALRQVKDLRPWLRRLLNPMTSRGHRGIEKLVDLLDDTKRAVDSAFEVKLRRLLKQARIPEPATSFNVTEDDLHVAQLDFAWPNNRPKVALLAHGERFHANTKRWKLDLKASRRLNALGWRVLEVSYSDVIRTPQDVVRDVRRALAGYVDGA